jgi:uncharacterized paraquat-inducible protein A
MEPVVFGCDAPTPHDDCLLCAKCKTHNPGAIKQYDSRCPKCGERLYLRNPSDA